MSLEADPLCLLLGAHGVWSMGAIAGGQIPSEGRRKQAWGVLSSSLLHVSGCDSFPRGQWQSHIQSLWAPVTVSIPAERGTSFLSLLLPASLPLRSSPRLARQTGWILVPAETLTERPTSPLAGAICQLAHSPRPVGLALCCVLDFPGDL